MTEPRYTSPIPPYQTQDAPRQEPLQGVVMGGPRVGYGAPGPQPRFVRQKSLLVAGLLAFLFPPIGMLYGTIFGALVMLLLSIPVALLTAGHGLAALWPLCVVWAVWGAHRTNQRRLAWASLGL